MARATAAGNGGGGNGGGSGGGQQAVVAVTTSGVARTAGALALAGAGALAYASLVEVRWYTLRQVTVPVLPAGQDPLRILHISDLHLTPGQRKKVDWVKDLASLDPHLVVDTGDNWAHLDAMPALLRGPGAAPRGPRGVRAGLQRLRRAHAQEPRAVPAAGRPPRRPAQRPAELPWRELTSRFRSAGWIDLTNRRDVLKVDGRVLSLVGTDDAHLDRDRFPAAGGDDDARTGSAPVDLHLGITHAPYRRVLDAMHADDVDLAIAGHTHGGQLAAAVLGRPGDQLRPRHPPRQGPARLAGAASGPAGRRGLDVDARVRGARHVAVRPRAVRVPAGSDAAHTRRSLIQFRSHARSSAILARLHGVWRSLVARFVRDEEVVGSNPATPTDEKGP